MYDYQLDQQETRIHHCLFNFKTSLSEIITKEIKMLLYMTYMDIMRKSYFWNGLNLSFLVQKPNIPRKVTKRQIFNNDITQSTLLLPTICCVL